MFAGLADVAPAFGRGQRFRVDGRDVVLQLVKNPAGFRQTLRTLDDGSPDDGIVVVINDDYADGRDVSWLWDVDFAALRDRSGRIATSGTRAADMALRLHYDAVTTDDVAARPGTRRPRRRGSGRTGRPGRRVQHLHRDVGAAPRPAADRAPRHERR